MKHNKTQVKYNIARVIAQNNHAQELEGRCLTAKLHKF